LRTRLNRLKFTVSNKKKKRFTKKDFGGYLSLDQPTQNGTMQELKNIMLSCLQKERDRELFEDQ